MLIEDALRVAHRAIPSRTTQISDESRGREDADFTNHDWPLNVQQMNASACAVRVSDHVFNSQH
jgi:hypothetical protein